jgi:predicted ATP-dependent serine protease
MFLNHEHVEFTRIGDVQIPDHYFNRIKTGIEELDSIFGNGILPGSTITLIANPGTGKSVFSLILAEKLTQQGYKVGYTSGEEDIRQIAYNAKRLNVKNLQIATITNVEDIVKHMENMDLLVIDSFQCLTTDNDLNSRQKIQHFVNTLVKKAKVYNCALLFIVQMTTSGELKGGTTLPYAVDVNLKIDKDKDLGKDYRIIDVYKNRFGPTAQYKAIMESTGYTFLGIYEPEEKVKESKVSKSQVRKDTIMNMVEPPLITVSRVSQELDISIQTANNLLRELASENKLRKYGRGSDSVWKVNTVKEDIFLTELVKELELK